MLTFTNQATLSYRNRVQRSNVTTGQITDALTAQKQALTESYQPGDYITYVVSLMNNGTGDVTALTVTDDLGGYDFQDQPVYPLSYVEGSIRYFVDGVQQAEPTVTPGAPLVISGIQVPTGGNVQLIYVAQVTDYASPEEDGVITNTATVTGNALTAPVTASATINAQTAPELSITKALNPQNVGADRQITYTFTIENRGNTATVAGDNVVITDTFDPILSNLAVTMDGSPLPKADNYTYDETTGAFATVPGAITVPAATFTQDPNTGAYTVEPGEAVITVSGTI